MNRKNMKYATLLVSSLIAITPVCEASLYPDVTLSDWKTAGSSSTIPAAFVHANRNSAPDNDNCKLISSSLLRSPTRSIKRENSSSRIFGNLSKENKSDRFALYSTSSSSTTTGSARQDKVWYSDPNINRSIRPDIIASTEDMIDYATSSMARYVLFHGDGSRAQVYHSTFYNYNDEDKAQEKREEDVDALFLSYREVESIVGKDLVPTLIDLQLGHVTADDADDEKVLAWLGERNGNHYWALHFPEQFYPINSNDSSQQITMDDALSNILQHRQLSNNIDTTDGIHSNQTTIQTAKRSPLREVGDKIPKRSNAAILATANGLLQFHATNRYCTKCGSRTRPTKAGSARVCTNNNCPAAKRATYPRIDVAAIMLVTSGRSTNDDYALLGRKKNWPAGRYSTLAGFAEVGETLEECCVRETFEESGVEVDVDSVAFVASQPWPFPKSLMVGFRACAAAAAAATHVDHVGDEKGEERPNDEINLSLPKIIIDTNEMEDIRWFHRDYVAARLDGGSTALGYNPTESEREFHIPGKASLARVLISQWALE